MAVSLSSFLPFQLTLSSVVLSLLLLIVLYYYFTHFTRSYVFPASGSSYAPPIVRGYLPWLGCGLSFVFGPPRSYLDECRRVHGDTFILFMFGIPFLYVFSPQGVKSLYNLRENEASFAEATRGLLGLKLPAPVLDGSMKKFHVGLKRNLMPTYLHAIEDAVDREIATLKQHEGKKNEFEIFHLMRTIVHRVGFGCWIGAECCSDKYLGKLIKQFDSLDPEQGFKSLASLATTIFTFKAKEKAAIRGMGEILKEIWSDRTARRQQQGNDTLDQDNLDQIIQEAEEECKTTGNVSEDYKWSRVACSVIQFHVASQANLYAALSHTLIALLIYPQAKYNDLETLLLRNQIDITSVDEIDQDLPYLTSVIQEALRLSQQSITLRKVLKTCEMQVDGGKITLPKGLYVSTLLSITNVDKKYFDKESPPIAAFNPTRYNKDQLDDNVYKGDKVYNISTFGHGYHSCPGFQFAMMTMKYVICRLIKEFQLQPKFSEVNIPQTSIGAIARATHPCIVQYKSRKME